MPLDVNNCGFVPLALYAGRSRRQALALPAAGDLAALSLTACSLDDVHGASGVSLAAALMAEDSYNAS